MNIKYLLILVIATLFCTDCGRYLKNSKMNTISSDINKILEIQTKLGYYMPKVLNKGLSVKEIEAAEQKCNMAFNDDLKDLYHSQNGISEKGIKLGDIGILPIYYFFELNDAIIYSQNMDWNEFKEYYEVENEIGVSFFPFLHNNAGDCYWANLNKGSKDYGRIYWTNTLGSEPEYLFNSISHFIKAMRIGYESNIFYVDSNRYLKMNHDKWWELCNSLYPDISYWQSN